MQRSDFKHFLEIPIRWGDMDAFGHVNNVQYLRYLESGRVAYFEDVLQTALISPKTVILADIQCAFRQQLHYPAIVEVASRVSRIGNSSMQRICAVYRKEEDVPVATAKEVVVWYDYEERCPKTIPQSVRQAVIDFEIIAPES